MTQVGTFDFLPRLAKSKPARWCAGACLVVLWNLGAVGSAQAEDHPRRTFVLQLKWYHQFQFAGYYAAKFKGFYQEEGLNVLIREANAHTSPLHSLEKGADFTVSDADLLLARMNGSPVVACAAIFQHSPYVLMSREDRGIRSPSDLIGRAIMADDGQGKAQVQAMLKREGIPLDSVTILPHSWRNDDLIEGKVDAILAYSMVEPFQMQQAGVEPSTLRTLDYGIDFYGDALFTTEKLAENEREQVAAFVRASLRGWEYAMKHQGEIIDLILKMPSVKQRGLTRANLEFEARGMVPLVLPDVIDIGHMNRGRWERMAQTLREVGVVSGDHSLDGFLFEPNPAVDRRVLVALLMALGVAAFAGGVGVLWTFQLRRRVEKATVEARQSEANLAAIFENTPASIWSVDREYRYVTFNSQFRDVTYQAVDRAPEIGLALDAILPAEQAAQWRKLYDRALAGERFSFEYSYTFHNGLRLYEASFNPIVSDGQITGVSVFNYDVTERKAAVEALKVLENRNQMIVETALDAVVSTGADGRILQWNGQAERVFGWTSQEAIGQPLLELISPERLRQTDWIVPAQLLAGGSGSQRVETYAMRRDGSELPVELSVTVSGTASGPVMNAFVRDITRRRELEEKLRQSQKMEAVGQLAGGVAHDFNNILTVIQGNVSLLQMGGMPDEEVAAALGEVMDAAERGGALTQQLLTFSRRQLIQLRDLDLNTVVTRMTNMLKRLIGEDITLRTELSPEVIGVRADVGMLEQVLLNLVVNARDAMRKGGQLVIRTSRVQIQEASTLPPHGRIGVFARIDVVDTGMGISQDLLPRIFEPFFTTKAVGKGTGLGLATAFGIVQQHNGWMHVDSEPERGSTFSIYLPDAGSIQVPTAAAPVIPARANGGNETILVVEDEEAVRVVVRNTLKIHGYTVLEAVDGPSALAIWKERGEEVSLLLTDMVMPGGMSGHDVATRLLEQRRELKVIYSSGYSAEVFRRDFHLPRGVGFLRKPYRSEELLLVVRRSLDGLPLED